LNAGVAGLSDIAAVDLGSNSFRLQMARLEDGQLVFHDSLREMVRLGAGLGKDKYLDAGSQQRAIECLKRFGERLRGFDPHAVRAVATNTFRVARNAPQLLEAAQQALGFPIEVIAGREEARMIFIGVSHGLPPSEGKRMVMDIGGGSTEFIIGEGFEPQRMESLYMGCVSYSMRFFGDGKLSESNLKKAEIAARAEVQTIRSQFSAGHWNEAVGSSGSARALGEILMLNGLSDGRITRHGLEKLRDLMLRQKEVRKLQLEGLSQERAPSFPGGFAIMAAAFAELGIDAMTVANSALREGVLYEMLGRMHDHDTREATVARFKRRYHVDAQQARRVTVLASKLLDQVAHRLSMELATASHYLTWAGKLHEIGVSIAHSGYHRHSAYIVENADMPGFSRMEQQTLGLLLRSQRRSLAKLALPPLEDDRCALIAVLRLAVLFHRNRTDVELPQLVFGWNRNGFRLRVDPVWLSRNPLTEAALQTEVAYWKDAGVELSLD
jgi:exopolyphosphatase / guanosine-5'-triphosphate,3'-diphosphate pyrophosphatase